MRSSSQWKKNHWSVNANALVASSADEIVFYELVTPEDLGSTEFLQARATEKRIRGWGEWSLQQALTIPGDNTAILMAYIAKLDNSTVDAAVASGNAASLDPLDPELDEAYAGNSIMWTGGAQILRARNNDDDTNVNTTVFKSYHVTFDVPVSRKLEGDEGIFLVYKSLGNIGDDDVTFSAVIRTLFQE